MNITITIQKQHSDEISRSPDSCLRRTSCPAFSGFPNDWLPPTDSVLGLYGVGQRGDLRPIPLFISIALKIQSGKGASARI